MDYDKKKINNSFKKHKDVSRAMAEQGVPVFLVLVTSKPENV